MVIQQRKKEKKRKYAGNTNARFASLSCENIIELLGEKTSVK